MKLIECHHCGQLLYFENTRCERCRHVLGYLPDRTILSALAAEGSDRWRPLAAPDEPCRFCTNAVHGACNWLVPADGPAAFCSACRLNWTIPNLDAPENLLLWQRLEAAKHRLVYGLLRLGLPLVNKIEDAEMGLAFDFLAGKSPHHQDSAIAPDRAPVLTGTSTGIDTLTAVARPEYIPRLLDAAGPL